MSEIAFLYGPQTPVKPISVPWLRVLCQYDVSLRLLRFQGMLVQPYRYIDDTSLQVAILIDHMDTLGIKDLKDIPSESVGEFLGEHYVRANQTLNIHQSQQIKRDLEAGHRTAEFLIQPHLDQQYKDFARLGMDIGSIVWESELISDNELILKQFDDRDELLDYRPDGGDVFWDSTREQLPLIVLKSSTGYSFICKCLTFMRSLHIRHTKLIFQALDEDRYIKALFDRVLDQWGVQRDWLMTARPKMDGSKLSARHGGWHGYTLTDLWQKGGAECDQIFNLGLRLYMLGYSSPDKSFNFCWSDFQSHIKLAHNILEWLQQKSNFLAKASTIEMVGKCELLLDQQTTIRPERIAKATIKLFHKLKRGKSCNTGNLCDRLMITQDPLALLETMVCLLGGNASAEYKS